MIWTAAKKVAWVGKDLRLLCCSCVGGCLPWCASCGQACPGGHHHGVHHRGRHDSERQLYAARGDHGGQHLRRRRRLCLRRGGRRHHRLQHPHHRLRVQLGHRCFHHLPDLRRDVADNRTADDRRLQQPDASAATSSSAAVLKIEHIGASSPPGATGLRITAANSTLKGLVINRWTEA
jgi:hypothetical protein